MAAIHNFSLLQQLTRLSLTQCSRPAVRNFTSSSGPLLFQSTSRLDAEPMKKKKKMDMSIVIGREVRRRKKLEKAIRKQEQKGQILKPIEEIEGDRNLLKTLDKRKRVIPPISFEESESRAHLFKEWTRYKTRQYVGEMVVVNRVMNLQTKALTELRKESEQLYQQAIQLDEHLFPFETNGPLETPPIKGYVAPDGDYIDTTRKFDK